LSSSSSLKDENAEKGNDDGEDNNIMKIVSPNLYQINQYHHSSDGGDSGSICDKSHSDDNTVVHSYREWYFDYYEGN
jgi:hypothetical protein